MSNRGLPLRGLAGSNVDRMPPPVECRVEYPPWQNDATRAAPRSLSHPLPRKPNAIPCSSIALVAGRVSAGGDRGAFCRHPLRLSWQGCRRPRMPPRTAARPASRRMTPTGRREWRIHAGRALNRGSAAGKPAAPIWRHGPVDSDAGLVLLAASASQQTDRRRLGQRQRPSA